MNSKAPRRSRRYFFIFCLIFGLLAALLAVMTTRTLLEVDRDSDRKRSRPPVTGPQHP